MESKIREIYYSAEYEEYLASLPQRIKEKFSYVEAIIRTMKVISTKFVKNIESTEFYEARVSVGSNEYRTILFAVDSESFMESTRVIFLNAFLKKDNKQYKREAEKARRILKRYEEETL